ncbi:Flotillin-1, partial [Ophiophagus hannah]
MIAGGRVFVVPCVQQIQRISLNTLTLNVKSEKVYTRHGVKIQGQNKEMLAAACQMFLGKSEAEVAQIALETLEGHQRAIMAHMTVEEIYKDRQKFSEQVFKVASSDLVNMGISVVSYTLKDIHDDQVAKTKQKIEEEKMQVLVVERTQQIQIQEQEMIRKERALEAQVKKPAEAERYRLEKLAEAERTQLIMQAEAEAEAIRVKGEAQAYAVEAKARADAEQMSKKAEAFKQYQEVAMVDMLLEKLPEITMVSSGNGDVGAAKMTGEVLEIMNKLPDTVEKLTGVSISQVSLEDC